MPSCYMLQQDILDINNLQLITTQDSLGNVSCVSESVRHQVDLPT